MTRRNIDPLEFKPDPRASFAYPSPDEVAAMVREAQLMRARAIADTARWLWRLVTRRRAGAAPAGSAAIKA